jgi:hypothetical protein
MTSAFAEAVTASTPRASPTAVVEHVFLVAVIVVLTF